MKVTEVKEFIEELYTDEPLVTHELKNLANRLPCFGPMAERINIDILYRLVYEQAKQIGELNQKLFDVTLDVKRLGGIDDA